MTPALAAEFLAGAGCGGGTRRRPRTRRRDYRTRAWQRRTGAIQVRPGRAHYLRAMQIDPGYPDVREDYAELLYEVGRVEDSALAARSW